MMLLLVFYYEYQDVGDDCCCVQCEVCVCIYEGEFFLFFGEWVFVSCFCCLFFGVFEFFFGDYGDCVCEFCWIYYGGMFVVYEQLEFEGVECDDCSSFDESCDEDLEEGELVDYDVYFEFLFCLVGMFVDDFDVLVFVLV